MANSTSIQILVDGPRNAVIKVVGTLDTSDLAATVIADPATLLGIDNTGQFHALRLRVKEVMFNVEDGLALVLTWDATTPVLIESLTGRGKMSYNHFGGLQNNAGAGVTGKIMLATQGFAASDVLSFTLILELVKQQNG